MTVSDSGPSSSENTPENASEPQVGVNGRHKGSRWPDEGRTLHRIRTVRRQQGMSLRTVARHLGSDVRSTRNQEDESNDLRLSDLYKWQKALGVPLVDLLEDPQTPLSRPVMERAHMVRIMKTVMAIVERTSTPALERLAKMLRDQLIEVMPELASVGPWHSVGQRRSLEEYGRAVERSISDELFQQSPLDIAD